MVRQKENGRNTKVEELNKPQIRVTQTEQICTLTIQYDEGLDKISYYWNNETNIIEENLNGMTQPFIKQILRPEGEYNILHIKATGIDGSVNEVHQELELINTQQPDKPKIEWYYNEETSEIDIIVESEKGINNLTYQWENDEEMVVESTEENQKKLAVTIDAKRGTNRITITATDSEGNTQKKETIILGIYKPEFKVQLINNDTIVVDVSHDKGFKKVIIDINGTELVYDETHPQYSKDITHLDTSVHVEPGTANVKIKVYTLEAEEKEYSFNGSVQVSQ